MFADYAVRSTPTGCWSLLQTKGDEDGLGHPFIERRYCVALCMLVKRIMEDAHDGGVAPAEYSGYAPAKAAISPRWSEFYQHLIALHGAVHLVGRNEDIVIAAGLAGLRPHKTKAVAMYIQPAGD